MKKLVLFFALLRALRRNLKQHLNPHELQIVFRNTIVVFKKLLLCIVELLVYFHEFLQGDTSRKRSQHHGLCNKPIDILFAYKVIPRMWYSCLQIAPVNNIPLVVLSCHVLPPILRLNCQSLEDST